jgi:hypothetical protein
MGLSGCSEGEDEPIKETGKGVDRFRGFGGTGIAEKAGRKSGSLV